ncbi:MAG: S49 family peptidase, partial [Pseudomonadota bacterium]
ISGGYWISMASDEIMADRSTVTGSIGVFSLIPTADKVADKLGIHTAGHTTTWLAGATNPLRPLDPRFGQLIQSSVTRIYAEFTGKAAVSRKTTQAKIDAVGQGRVWTGLQAQERGLVDTIGSFGDALRSAAKRAKLADGYRVAYIERDESPFERALAMLGASSVQSVNIQVKLGLLEATLPNSALLDAGRELAWLSDLSAGRKPFQAITHCMCGTP